MAKYIVWCPDFGQDPEDGREIDSYSPQGAACEWAQREDTESADYSIVGGQDTTVIVRAVAHGAETYEMIVCGESVPQYRAQLLIPLSAPPMPPNVGN